MILISLIMKKNHEVIVDMRGNERKSKDPVCGMMVNSGELSLEYLQMNFSFCSMQCRDRFVENPRLYVGTPGSKSAKQRGEVLIKQRKINLSCPMPENSEQDFRDALLAMMGVNEVLINGSTVIVSYDLLQATAAQIEEQFVQFGISLGDGWGDRLRRAWIDFVEEEQLAGMEVGSGLNRDGCH